MYKVHEPGVVIVGGGLVGLSAALFLRAQSVSVLLLERHATTSPQPKARRINLRTMELFRQLGIEAEVTAAAAALADFQAMAAGPSLAEAERLPFVLPGGLPEWDKISPTNACLCAQDLLEPVLRRLAVERGADVRFETEALSTVDDGDAVTVTFRNPDGTVEAVRSHYVIAADGARSPIRERLGIPRSGRGTLGQAVNVHFRADLTELVRGREFNLCQIENPAAPGAIASIDGADRWIFMTTAKPAGTTTPDEWAATLRTAVGVPGLDVEILSVLAWEPGMFVADLFGRGRIFLAGDAAHVMPPYAAAGANTGIQDVHNLAWKLAVVLNGTASPSLLDTYHTERHAVGWFTADQSSVQTANLRRLANESTDGTPPAHPLALVLGLQYRRGALIGDGSTAALDHLDLTGQPGTRLPHHWLAPGRSTLDLVGPGFTLIAGSAADLTPGPFTVHRTSHADHFGITDKGVLLIRPDQIVAWRSTEPPHPDPNTILADILTASD